jgi:hypothetical protein
MIEPPNQEFLSLINDEFLVSLKLRDYGIPMSVKDIVMFHKHYHED